MIIIVIIKTVLLSSVLTGKSRIKAFPDRPGVSRFSLAGTLRLEVIHLEETMMS